MPYRSACSGLLQVEESPCVHMVPKNRNCYRTPPPRWMSFHRCILPKLADVLRLASFASIQSEASMCSCIGSALFSIQYLPIGCAPSTRSFVLPQKNSKHVQRAVPSCMLSMERCWTERFHRSGRLCKGSGTTGPNSAKQSSEQSVLKLDLFVSVHMQAHIISAARNGRP